MKLPKKQYTLVFLIVLLLFTPFSSALDLSKFTSRDFNYHPDHFGSTDLVKDESQQIAEETTYKSFGEPIDDGFNRYLHGGKVDFTGIYYYGARYYNPILTKFVQPDSSIPNPYNPQDLNRYSYVRNNPYKYTDPNGLAAVEIGLVPSGGIGLNPTIGVGGQIGAGVAISYSKEYGFQGGWFTTIGGGGNYMGGKLGVNIVSFSPSARNLRNLEEKGSLKVGGEVEILGPFTGGLEVPIAQSGTTNSPATTQETSPEFSLGVGGGGGAHLFGVQKKTYPWHNPKDDMPTQNDVGINNNPNPQQQFTLQTNNPNTNRNPINILRTPSPISFYRNNVRNYDSAGGCGVVMSCVSKNKAKAGNR